MIDTIRLEAAKLEAESAVQQGIMLTAHHQILDRQAHLSFLTPQMPPPVAGSGNGWVVAAVVLVAIFAMAIMGGGSHGGDTNARTAEVFGH